MTCITITRSLAVADVVGAEIEKHIPQIIA
jgi:hypothetical protein